MNIFRSADKGDSFIIIPSIVIAEIIYIAENKEVEIDFSNLMIKIEESKNYIVYNLNLEVLNDMQNYKKFIVKAKLITKDVDIKNSGYIETLW